MKLHRRVLGISVDGLTITATDYRIEDHEDMDEFMATIREMLVNTPDWSFVPGGARSIEKHKENPIAPTPKTKKGR